MTIDTVLFDFDGTLADTNEMIIGSWQHTYRTLRGEEEPLENILKTFGEPLALSMEKAFPETPVDQAIAVYRSFQEEHFEEMIRPFPAMDELIRRLKREGYKVGIVTSRLRNTTMRGLRQFGLDGDVDIVVTCEDTQKHKPDPQPASEALLRLGSKPENAMMVGDSIFDIRCAHGAGLKAVKVGWAAASSEGEEEESADAVAETAEDILWIIESMERSC